MVSSRERSIPTPRVLDVAKRGGHPCGVNQTILPALLTMCLAAGPALGQLAPPGERPGRNNVAAVLEAQDKDHKSSAVPVAPEIEQSAVAAVNELGKQVVMGNHKVALDRMYPAWKEKFAAQVPGGMKALEKTMENLGKEMAKNGTSVISFRAAGPVTAYEVESGKEPLLDDKGKPVIDKESGKPVEKMLFKKWLLVVPTLTEFRFTEPPKPGELPKIRVAVSHSFQVVISDKGKNDWTFIDGATLRISELRRLFFNLPQDMALPEIKKEEKKTN